MTYAEKLAALRALLKAKGVDGFIVPRSDEYQGEYIPDSSDRLRFITGFTGSAGHAVILQDRAAAFSDGRYTIQLRREIDPALFEAVDSTKVTVAEWLVQCGAMDRVIGYDPRLHTPASIKAIIDKGVTLQPLAANPVDAIWSDRPAPPAARVETFPLAYAGKSAPEKLDEVTAALTERRCDAAVITLPDSIAWLLNVRSADIAHIPVALSTAILRGDGTVDWFIDDGRVPAEVRAALSNRVALIPPGRFMAALGNLRGRVLVDGKRSSAAVLEAVGNAEIIDAKDPVIALRARKNAAERHAMREAHIRDGVALVRFLKWFSEEAETERLTEIAVEENLERFRKDAPEFRETSFDTIAGYGANGAVIHYRATGETNAVIRKGGLFLLDSGAQYADGTTDVTRTVAVGEPTREMRERFTLVLKGHIAVATAKFPAGTSGAQIDALARAPLWRHGLDYAHGTGHGVGVYLSVHEEAASLSPRGLDPVEEGMILSNEPGYYEEGAYGIRLENLLLVQADGMCAATGKAMLSFETLTLAPFDRNAIVAGMLSPEEIGWLDAYHARVYATLAPLLDAETRAWLAEATRPL